MSPTQLESHNSTTVPTQITILTTTQCQTTMSHNKTRPTPKQCQTNQFQKQHIQCQTKPNHYVKTYNVETYSLNNTMMTLIYNDDQTVSETIQLSTNTISITNPKPYNNNTNTQCQTYHVRNKKHTMTKQTILSQRRQWQHKLMPQQNNVNQLRY